MNNAHARETVRVMHSQIVNLRHVVNHHFKNRHDGRGNQSVRNWIKELRRIDKASGYSEALKELQATMSHK